MPPDTEVVDQPLQSQDNVDNAKDDAGVSQETGAPAAADPSTATDASKPDGTLSVVRDVVDARRQDPAAASSASDEEPAQKADDGTPKEPDDENFSDVPFHKHPRFQRVIGELKTARVDAARYQNVQRFLDSNGVTADEAADTLTIAALAKTNPAEAWKRVQPWVQKLLIAAGEVLPDDLQQRVAKGELTADAALEVSRSRATVQSTAAQRTFEQQQAERQTQQSVVRDRMNAVASWETDRRLKDPNFEAKFGPLQREVAFLQRSEGVPKDAAGALDQLKRAYDAVNKSFKPAVVANRGANGQFQAVRPVTGGQVASVAAAQPETTLGLIRATRAKMRAAG